MNKTIARIAKTLIVSASLAVAAAGGNASAAVWQTPYGVMMSDTCVAPSGAYMIFPSQPAPVGTACWFTLYGVPGTFYGVYR